MWIYTSLCKHYILTDAHDITELHGYYNIVLEIIKPWDKIFKFSGKIHHLKKSMDAGITSDPLYLYQEFIFKPFWN